MAKEIYYDADCRGKLKAGIDTVANAVKVTLGPKGRNAVLGQKYQAPLVTNDGVTIANEITLEDTYENIGAQLIREVATKTNDAAGDGTTTAIVLAQAMVEEGMKNLAAGANPVLLRRGIEDATVAAIHSLEAMARPIQNAEEIKQIVWVSSEDKEIAELLSEALQKVNDANGVIVENSQTMKSYLEVQPGFCIERGYISANMVNQPAVSQCIYEDADILIIDKKFSTMNEIYPILELSLTRKKPMLMVVDSLEGEALQMVNMNNERGILSIVAIEGPTHGENRQKELLDVEAMVGGQAIVGEVIGMTDQITEGMLGHAERVVVEKGKTTIVGGMSDSQKIQQRIMQVKDELQELKKSDFAAQICQKRLNRLAGNTVVVKVGASTETEYNEKKLRIEDALHAATAALETGIVPGGGTTYVRMAAALEHIVLEEDDANTGIAIVKKALLRPLAQIVMNCGAEPYIVVEKVQQLQGNYGYNILVDTYEDMVAAGIIEPMKVVKAALQNASSMAMMVLTAETMVGESK